MAKGPGCIRWGRGFSWFSKPKASFEVMIELWEVWADEISLLLQTKTDFSAGIAIAHFKSPPLYEVLKWARRMEQAAKDIDSGKRCFRLAVIKRSW